MLKDRLRFIADMFFYLACIAFIISLTAVYYFGQFKIVVKGHVVYWVYMAPLAMVPYAFLRNKFLAKKPPSNNEGEIIVSSQSNS